MDGHYARSEASYLKAAAEQAAAGLSTVDWQAVAEARSAAATQGTAGAGQVGQQTGAATGSASSAEAATALRRAQLVALSTQVRVRVYDPAGDLLVDSGLPGEIDVVGLTEGIRSDDDGAEGIGRGATGRMMDRGMHGLPSPVGEGLFGEATVEGGARSDRTIQVPLMLGGATVATMLLSEGPDYGAAVVRTTLVAWLIAGCAALVLAALAGWLYSRHLTRPLLSIAEREQRDGSWRPRGARGCSAGRRDRDPGRLLQRDGGQESGHGDRAAPLRGRRGA